MKFCVVVPGHLNALDIQDLIQFLTAFFQSRLRLLCTAWGLGFVPFVGTQLFSPTKRQLKYLAQSCQLFFDRDVNGVHYDTKQRWSEQHKSFTKHQLIHPTSPQITPGVHSFTGGSVLMGEVTAEVGLEIF